MCFDDRYPAQATDLSFAGMEITGDTGLTRGGNGNGDIGNWDLEGTCGSAFLGVNSNIGSTTVFNFTPSADTFSLDIGISRSFSNIYSVTAFNGAAQVAQRTVTVSGNGNPDGSWVTLPPISGVGPITSVEITATSGNNFAWGFLCALSLWDGARLERRVGWK